MIESKPAALPSCCVSTHSLIAIVAYTVEVTLPATPPAVSSGENITLGLPLSIINGDALSIHAAVRLRGRACPVCSQLNRADTRYITLTHWYLQKFICAGKCFLTIECLPLANNSVATAIIDKTSSSSSCLQVPLVPSISNLVGLRGLDS